MSHTPTMIAVAMRMPYQRMGNGPYPNTAGMRNATGPGEANIKATISRRFQTHERVEPGHVRAPSD